MKRFFHPTLKSETLTTSLGKITLDKNGSAEVEDEVFDHLMKNPANAEYQEKLNAQGEPEKERLKKEDLELLDAKQLKAIAKERKIPFAKDVTPEELVVSIMADEEIKKPPPPPTSKPE
jgi:hypothetical protein